MNKILATRIRNLIFFAFLMGALPYVPKLKKVRNKAKPSAVEDCWTHDQALTSKKTRVYPRVPDDFYRISLNCTLGSWTYFWMCKLTTTVCLILLFCANLKGISRNRTMLVFTSIRTIFVAVANIVNTRFLLDRQDIEGFLNNWLLLTPVDATALPMGHREAEIRKLFQGMSGSASGWTDCLALTKFLHLGLFLMTAVNVLASITVSWQYLPLLTFSGISVEFQVEIITYTYILLASSMSDRARIMNVVLREGIQNGSRTTVVLLMLYHQKLRQQESQFMTTFQLAHQLNHISRLLLVVMNLANLYYFTKSSDGYSQVLLQNISVVYHGFAIIKLFNLGDRFSFEIQRTRDVLMSTKTSHDNISDAVQKFHSSLLPVFNFSMGRMSDLTAAGMWQEIQFAFTVFTVLIQLYET